jgi:hypothetical protein
MSRNALSREFEIIEKEKINDKYVTALKKAQFANEIKAGLGAKIKENPSGVKVIKKSCWQKVLSWFKDIFTKF